MHGTTNIKFILLRYLFRIAAGITRHLMEASIENTSSLT